MQTTDLLPFCEPLSPAGGVRIEGLDLSRPLSSDLVAAIRAAIRARHIVVFPAQALSRERQFAFAANFGAVEAHGGDRGETKRRDVAHVLSNLDPAGNPAVRMSAAANYHWHTDKPYRTAPPALTMLHAVEVPPPEAGPGGGTEFADTALAWDTLPEAMRRRIAGLRLAFRPAFDATRAAVDHPLVRTHPETGRKALYLGNHATQIVGLPPGESAALLAELLAHATRPEFVYAHRWRPGDFVVWDNRCLLHRLVLGDALRRHRRIMHRSVVAGSVPF